jgi:hypothetical protein
LAVASDEAGGFQHLDMALAGWLISNGSQMSITLDIPTREAPKNRAAFDRRGLQNAVDVVGADRSYN